MFDGEDSYKAFVEVVDKEGTKFQFSRFLVTNIWFKDFIKDKAYESKELWSKEALEFIQNNQIKKPVYFNDERFNHDFKPVVGISFYEAEAFCKWLNEKENKNKNKEEIKYTYALPSKEEFEYIASNKGNNKYPWGNDFDSKKCNNSVDSNLNKTTIVGAFSNYNGDNENGISDMSGNVWKWTSSDFTNDSKVIKGGSWASILKVVFDSSCDDYYKPNDRDDDIGFFLTRTRNT